MQERQDVLCCMDGVSHPFESHAWTVCTIGMWPLECSVQMFCCARGAATVWTTS